MNAIDLISKERHRQQAEEGWDAEHDSYHSDGSLAVAAACYAMNSSGNILPHQITRYWPWDKEWWKPKTPMRDLVRAGALIAAEIDRRLISGETP